MGLFKPDFYRSFGIGFGIGAVVMAIQIATRAVA